MAGGTVRSISSLIKKPEINRQNLSKYSWLPDVLRVEGSIIAGIIGPVLTVTVFASVVAYTSIELGHHLSLTNSVVPLLSVVVGLILVFRNGTSYERFAEGSKDWGALVSLIRNLTRLIWINVHVPNTQTGQSFFGKGKTNPSADKGLSTSAALRAEKIRVLKLGVAYAYAVKHHLRGELGAHHEDFRGVLPDDLVTRFDETGYDRTYRGSPESYSAAGTGTNTRAHSPTRIRFDKGHPMPPDAETPLLSDSRAVEFHPYAERRPFPLPLLIAHEISKTIYRFRRAGALDIVGPAGANAMSAMVSSMIDQLTAMERVSKTPIPISYSIHLKQCVTLYLFTLPFTLVGDLRYFMIPVVTVVAFTLMGIEGIADEIEMPFGTDDCDLPLDEYCRDLRSETEYTIERLPERSDDLDPFSD